MSQTDALKRYLEAGMAFTQLTRTRAEQVVKDLVAAGDLQRNQAKEAIDELIERSRKNTDVLAEQVRSEVDSQLSNMGLARKADVERLEAELERLKGSGAKKSAEPTKAKTPAGAPEKKLAKPAETAKKAPAKKAPAKKAGGDMAPVSGGLPGASAREDDDEPAPAKKAPVKKATADKAPVSGELPAKRAAKAAKKQS